MSDTAISAIAAAIQMCVSIFAFAAMRWAPIRPRAAPIAAATLPFLVAYGYFLTTDDVYAKSVMWMFGGIGFAASMVLAIAAAALPWPRSVSARFALGSFAAPTTYVLIAVVDQLL